ncbi:anti-sigma regulatory factor [Oceanobacillus profundus]|uniref:Anti-sigma regulatory factor n=1 Tax=Oceanobacillus profundus TaxID=372463 RepID=A0A417YEA1_9BACI|nr:anti-sigma regulatory factor [Oceanobacillus profundus]MBR3119242.1 anti-sigma regulatory factor [Oceanobacillus sp.]PAE28346.1 ATP-binding protein [Paenibacillus sp. 7884-2]MCM3399071.1 anti-sigma regulatory factor [Oceanobacillus profundus]MDO6450569.1 anti-sigma regulatory factor [Oceanobacillus profundus]RHW30960.1 anti-sigma regulatory factor [Oceanobacillus profundus]
MEPQSCVNIHKEWDIVGARQLGREMAKNLGFGTVDQARIATAVSELARNIYLYAEQGQVCFEIIDSIERRGLCMMAIDSGPGIADIGQVMQDGFTTSGGLGAGLPGVKRLMDEFDIRSEVGEGTKIIATKWIR